MDKPEPVSLPLEYTTVASEASTLPSTPEQPSPGSARRRGAVVRRMRRVCAPKRARREAHAQTRWGLPLGISTVTSTISKPDTVMKFSTMAAASGGVCLVVAVFSGPALVFIAVFALGVCGICYSVRQRGALEYLPSGVVDLLTRTTLLEFLTDTSVFDAVKTYLVFMMGLSADETQGVLGSLPDDMRHTLTRPGMMHTLPRPLQDLLLPPGAAVAANGQEAVGPRRRRRLAGTEGFAAREQNDGEEIDAPPLGQLVWNPLRAGPVPDRAMARGEATGRVDEDDPALSDEGSDDSEEEITEEEVTEEEETGQRERGRRSAHWAGGAIGSADNDTRRRPWEEETHRHATRSLSPVDGRSRTRSRAATDVAEADGGGVQSARRVSSALPEQARRREAAAGWFGRVNGNTAGGGHLEAARAAADEGVPSAERLVASILQRRVDSAVKAAWSAVDERGVRRAAVGSGVALAAHMAFSERARRQAGAMLRGSFLAALAATATVCAGLVYLKPGESVRGQSASDATDSSDREQPAETEEETGVDASTEASGPEEGEERLSRMRRYRNGMRRWLTTVTPSTRNLVRWSNGDAVRQRIPPLTASVIGRMF